MTKRWTWILDSALLFALTAYLIWPMFLVEYDNNWASIQSTFISDARFLRENLPHPGWQPNWYCGTRFDYVYPPALRYGTALLSLALNVSTARSYHLYTAFFYCLGIAGVYLFARTAWQRRGWSFFAALTTTVLSPSFLLLPHFLADYAGERFMPIRLGVLTRYGEGPHITSFSLLPFAFAAAWIGLRRGRNGWLLVSAAFTALAVSNNFYGATALAMFFPVLVWSVFLGEGRDWRVFARALVLAALAYGWTALWLVPSFVRVTLRNMRLVSQPGNQWSAWLLGALLLVFAVVSWRFVRNRDHAWPAFVWGSLAIFGLSVVGNAQFNFRVLGEPQRLVPELDFCILLAAAMILAALSRRGLAGKAVVVLVVLAALYPVKGWLRNSWEHIPAPARPEERVEYKLTQWIHDNVPGQRVLATGSLRFWYNAWFDLPQTGGGSEQGTLNLIPLGGYYAAVWPVPARDAIAWLQAVGTDAFVIHDKNSQEIYKDFREPHAYDNQIPVIYDDGQGNRIFQVPRRLRHIARVVTAKTVEAIVLPPDGMPQMPQVFAYADALEKGPESLVDFQREAPGRIRLRASLDPGQALIVQESFDPAWQARSGANPVPVTADPMQFMRLDPGPGNHDIVLEFTTPFENRVGQGVTLGTLGIYVVTLLRRKRR